MGTPSVRSGLSASVALRHRTIPIRGITAHAPRLAAITTSRPKPQRARRRRPSSRRIDASVNSRSAADSTRTMSATRADGRGDGGNESFVGDTGLA